jgi:hypothetical protein
VREGLIAFFGREPSREPADRFHNGDKMRRAWQQAFKRVDKQYKDKRG